MANNPYGGNNPPKDPPKDPPKGPTGDPPNNQRGPWTPPGPGSFTGIDYNRPGAADGLDPYLVWSDVGGFANLRKPGQTRGDSGHIPVWLPVLIELAPLAKLADLLTPERAKSLVVEAAYLQRAATDAAQVVPARAKRAFFIEFATGRLLALVQRIELDLPQEAQPADTLLAATVASAQALSAGRPAVAPKKIANNQKNATTPALLTGKVIAFIDDGCAFAHAHFLQGHGAGVTPRVKRLWDQNERAPGSQHAPPAGFSEGRAFTDADLKAFILARTYNGVIDEDAVYADFAQGTRDKVNRLQRRVAHGTHVMDLACGPHFLEDTMTTRPNVPAINPTWARANDDASEAPIIFVQLPMRTVQSTSGKGTLTADVLHALQYISDQCDANAEIVVNLSWGTLAGPHDGSTVLERGIDSLIAAQPPGRLRVVIPAGNGFQSRSHANFSLGPLERKTLDWRVLPDDATESYVEFWLQAGDEVRITLTLPDGRILPNITRGLVYRFVDPSQPFADPISILGAHYANTPPAGQAGQCVLLAIAPTVSLLASRPVAPHGLWKITVENVKNQPIAVIDAYIERDDVAVGTRRGARQSHFDDPLYRVHDTEDLNPAPAGAYVFREGIFNGIGNGRRILSVGGVRESDLVEAEYSPTGLYTRPARPGTQHPVHYFATSEESRTLHGVRAAGTRSGGTVRLSGTSDAAPQIARDLLNGTVPTPPPWVPVP